VTERSLADEWEAHSGAWQRWTRTPGHDHYFHRFNWPSFLELVPGPGRATLDLGCGEGRVGVALRQLGHRVTGVDISPSLAQLASETGGYEDVVVADASTLPFADGAFDLVVAFMSLQDMDDAAGALTESARSLEPGGRLVAAIVHPIASAHLGREAGEQRRYFDEQRMVDTVERDGIAFTFHQIHRSLQSWSELLRDAGFLIEDLREPRPSTRVASEVTALARAREKPAFLHVRCLRPR
jgi:SAM-dependent methyltransferase